MSLHPEQDETVAMGPVPVTRRPVTPLDPQRFAPGTLLAARYRIVSRLGKGGMGEVFRAEDIMLGQPVALKFLPENARSNVHLLTRFYDEVRIARQISHPNVCRVYDIGEIDGQPYLSMEYIDGEDLSSLLRRIGRLPGDKAAEFARKMCAGLAAAHAQGVLHRDIKPGNIMIDGRGEPRITDFGLAALGATVEGQEIRNGTPAYMAPEQLEGREVSVQSDLYALGLVFHEMFTGKAAHDAATVADLTKIRKEAHTTSAASLVKDLDPAVERAIQACLEPDPKLRPKSALDLARMLPGGDPLAAALAAGQTPSPELVAAAGSNEALAPKIGLLALAALIVGLLTAAFLGPRVNNAAKLPLGSSPDVLTDRARNMLRAAGYTESAADFAWGFTDDTSFSRYMQRRIERHEEWADVVSKHPGRVKFWYRESRRTLTPSLDTEGVVTPVDPPLAIEGMTRIETGLDGELVSFTAVPPQTVKLPPDLPAVDWNKFFELARLDMAKFQPAAPEWTPLVATGERLAWTGPSPAVYKRPLDIPLRVEAASFGGRPVYFQVIYPWTDATRAAVPQQRSNAWGERFILGLVLLLMLLAGGMAYYNWKTGRGDSKGAVRVGIAIASLRLAAWALRAHHSDVDFELTFFPEEIAWCLWEILVYWAFYLALEPWVRRFWPQVLVTWSRLLQGRYRDPMVGRDVLFGVTIGVYFSIYLGTMAAWVERMSNSPLGDFPLALLQGTNNVLMQLLLTFHGGVASVLGLLLMMFVLRLVLRKQWLAAAAFVALGAAAQAASSGVAWQYSYPFALGIYVIVAWVLLRWGMFATIFAIFTTNVFPNVFTTNYSAWYGQSSWITLALLALLGAVGYRIATAGKSIFGEPAAP